MEQTTLASGLPTAKTCGSCGCTLRVVWFPRVSCAAVRLGAAIDAVPRRDRCADCGTEAGRRAAEPPLTEPLSQHPAPSLRKGACVGPQIRCPLAAVAAQHRLQEGRCSRCASELE